MSSDRGAQDDPLVRRDYAARYRAILEAHLPPAFQGFAPFFADLGRLETMASLLRRHLPARARTILNAGCGPFAAEIFVAAFQDRRVTAFDYTPEFAPFFALFREEGMLGEVSFQVADAMRVELAPAGFDLIVMHDLLYEQAIRLDPLLARLRPALAPGGLVYLDVMNSRLRWLWRLLGKEKAYRRYRLSDVDATLARHDLRVVERRPVVTASGGAKALLQRVLALFGTGNAIAVVACDARAGER